MVGGATAEAARPLTDAWAHRIVHTLNIGTIAGLPLAVACYFLANRVLPVSMPARPEAEIQAFFGGWAAMALLVYVLPSPRLGRRNGDGRLRVSPRPVVGGLTIRHYLIARLHDGHGMFVLFDAVVLGIGSRVWVRRLRPETASIGQASARANRYHSRKYPQTLLATTRAAIGRLRSSCFD